MVISNKDFEKWRDRDILPMTIPRPGHADLAAAIKYGYKDLRLGLERASARETAARVAVGAVCRRFLAQFGMVVGSYVLSIGSVSAEIPDSSDYDDLFRRAESSPVRCPVEQCSDAMVEEIRFAQEAGDTLGGVVPMRRTERPAWSGQPRTVGSAAHRTVDGCCSFHPGHKRSRVRVSF